MSQYSEAFLEHYRRPRNLGDLDAPDAVAILHDDTCGDLVRLVVAVDRHEDAGGSSARRIREIRFKAYGCAATIAAASAITELAAGMLIEDARELLTDDVIEALDGLPPGRVHAAVLGLETLHAVLSRLQPACLNGSRLRERNGPR